MVNLKILDNIAFFDDFSVKLGFSKRAKRVKVTSSMEDCIVTITFPTSLSPAEISNCLVENYRMLRDRVDRLRVYEPSADRGFSDIIKYRDIDVHIERKEKVRKLSFAIDIKNKCLFAKSPKMFNDSFILDFVKKRYVDICTQFAKNNLVVTNCIVDDDKDLKHEFSDIISIKDSTVKIQRTLACPKFIYKIKKFQSEIIVIVPVDCSNASVSQFLLRHYEWLIYGKFGKSANRLYANNDQCDNGSLHYLWGIHYTLEVLTDTLIDKISVCHDKKIITVNLKNRFDERKVKSLLDTLYLNETERLGNQYLPQFSKHVNSPCNNLKSKKVKSYFGMYNIVKKSIVLSSMLARYPQECLKCTLIHELIHFHEHRHNLNFYSLLERYYPQWKEQYNLMGRKVR